LSRISKYGSRPSASEREKLRISENNYLTPVDTLANPFQGGMRESQGSSLGALTNLGQAINWLNQNPLRPYSWEI
jgi:hypothetical protein